MTENKNNQNTVDQDDPNKIQLTARGKKALAVGKTALVVGLAAAGVTAVASSSGEQSASADSKQEQPDPRYKVQEGDTLEEIAEADLEERARDQAFAEDPTPAEVDVREREIAGATNLATGGELSNPDELKVGQELVVPDETEVPISVTPEVAPEDLPPKTPGPTNAPKPPNPY